VFFPIVMHNQVKASRMRMGLDFAHGELIGYCFAQRSDFITFVAVNMIFTCF